MFSYYSTELIQETTVCLKDEYVCYISSAKLYRHSQVEWFCVFFDVPLYSDYLQEVKGKHIHGWSSDKFPRNGGSNTAYARQFFLCQTRASVASEFDKEKNGVLLIGRGSRSRLRSTCESDVKRTVKWTSGNVYQRSGYIVTPRERCRLQQDSL